MRNTESAFVGACMALASCGQPPNVSSIPKPDKDKIAYLAVRNAEAEASSYIEHWKEKESYIVTGCAQDNAQCVQDVTNKRGELSFPACDTQLYQCIDDTYARRGKGSSWRDLFKCKDKHTDCEDKELEKQGKWGELSEIYTQQRDCFVRIKQCIGPKLERKTKIEAMENDPEIAPIRKKSEEITNHSEKIWHKIMGTCGVIKKSALEDASAACFENKAQKGCSAQSKKLCSGDRADRSKAEWIACESKNLECDEIYHSCIQNLHQRCFGDFGK